MIRVTDLVVKVDDVTLLPRTSVRVDPGQALIVRGHNGAGKSTLLRVLAGMRTPTSGTVTIAGRPVARRDRTFRRSVAALVGLPPMATDLTVEDHVRLVAATWFEERRIAEASATEALGSLGLEGLVRRFPHELSTGQQQLVGLALVLARPFDVLVLDEPEQRLDADRLDVVGRVLGRRRDAGATLVVATHSTALADGLADRVLDLDARR
ncbi:ABC transporter ATP-binding protein [Curtobacterium sp. ISL-83]|nr:ABC transporter ATP-binding protein [Curtobacterium sp. ISL-83]